jgi:hypothetical protein
MSLILQGSTSGSVTLQEPAVAGTTVLTLPATSGNVVVDSATQTLTNKTIEGGTVISGTAVSASSTSVDFTSIPSWVKRITVMLDVVSTNGTSVIQLQLGDSGGIETSGYVSTVSSVSNTGFGSNVLTSGVPVNTASFASASYSGVLTCVKLSGNLWSTSISCIRTDTAVAFVGAGNKTLSDTLTQVRITTVNGTDTFDAGTINILYE